MELDLGRAAAKDVANEIKNGDHDKQQILDTKTELCSRIITGVKFDVDDCHSIYNCSNVNDLEQQIIDLDRGDPMMFEEFWRAFEGDASGTFVIHASEWMSYFANKKQHEFWFVQEKLAEEIRCLHQLVGNAVTEGRHILVGTGSTQLFQAALYALAAAPTPPQAAADGASDQPKRRPPASVVSASPFYSSYPVITDFLRSELYRWGGDATTFQPASLVDTNMDDDAAVYIELVTSPNNPDGSMRHPVVNGMGAVIHDLAYYWPQYTPISTAPADHDVMLFTLSKSAGHAGTRIGWAIVKDIDVAKRMAKYIELNTIGVSQDAQLRAAHILRMVRNEYAAIYYKEKNEEDVVILDRTKLLFHFASSEMETRWREFREAISAGDRFSLPHFPQEFCSFFGKMMTPHPAFAWLKCNEDSDCHELLKAERILTRGGVHFGASPQYVRVSMLDQQSSFGMFIDRMKALSIGCSRSKKQDK